MIAIFSKNKGVGVALLLLSLTTINRSLASEQQEEDYGRELEFTVLSTDEENTSDEEDTSSNNAFAINENQEANQIATRNNLCCTFLNCSLFLFYLDTGLIEIMYVILSLRYFDPLLICDSIILFAAFIRAVTCRENPTNSQLIQLVTLTCIGIVLGYLGKDKIFTIMRDRYRTEIKIQTKA